LHSSVISPQLRIRLHQCLLADGLLDFHLWFTIDIDAWLKNNLREEATKWKTSSALITVLYHNPQNVLAQVERQAEVDPIDKLGSFQDQITAPGNRPDVLLNDLGQHAVGGWQGTNPDRSRALLTMGNDTE